MRFGLRLLAGHALPSGKVCLLLLSTALLLVVSVGCPGNYDVSQDQPFGPNGVVATDAFFENASPGDGAVCVAPDYYCPGGKICFQGKCETPVCKTSPLCPGGGNCRPACVTTIDACAGVTCATGQTCVSGHCVKGCFPMPCAGVKCPAGQYCQNGRCVKIAACDASCGPGQTCSLVACAPDKCQGVACSTGQTCVDGKCLANPCAAVTCPAGFVCQNGKCIDSCVLFAPPAPPKPSCVPSCTTCGGPNGCGGICLTAGNCGPGLTCKNGKCVCVPNCVAKGCGAADGCGSVCKGCPTEGAICQNTGIAWLCCTPDCAGKACGAQDGCGGTCESGSCPAGQMCKGGTCVCAPDCVAKGCGTADGCGDVCRGCPTVGAICQNTGIAWLCCTPDCTGKACGADDGCGGTCHNGSCPSGQVCKSDKCVCAPSCSGKPCGAPNGCGGLCNGYCPSGQSCQSGKCVAPPPPPPPPPPTCSCGQQLVGSTCVPICGAGTTLCGCTKCCSTGYVCDWATITCKSTLG